MLGEPLIFQLDTQLVGVFVTGIVAIMVAIIGSVLGPILVARYSGRKVDALSQKVDEKIASVNTNVDQTKFAVTNEHGTHIRDDIDEIKSSVEELVAAKSQQSSQITALFSQQANQRARDKRRDKALASMAKAVIGVRTDIAALYDRDTSELEEVPELDEAIRELERTTPRSTLPKPPTGDVGFAHEETPHDPA